MENESRLNCGSVDKESYSASWQNPVATQAKKIIINPISVNNKNRIVVRYAGMQSPTWEIYSLIVLTRRLWASCWCSDRGKLLGGRFAFVISAGLSMNNSYTTSAACLQSRTQLK